MNHDTMQEEEIDKALSEFGQSCMTMAAFLQNDPVLSRIQQLYLENHLTIVQLHYTLWHFDKPRLNRPASTLNLAYARPLQRCVRPPVGA